MGKPADAGPDAPADGAGGEGGTEAGGLGGPGAANATEACNAGELSDTTTGPHRAICGKYFANHSVNFEPPVGKHQYAPVAKKNTCNASQRVRKKRWRSTIPRQRAAISVNIAPMKAAIPRAKVPRPTQNPLSGAGPPGGSKNCGIDGCGLKATALPLRIVAAS